MSNNLSSRESLGPLSPGNVVSTALVLYRSHFKTYLTLAANAYLWLLVPLYGWAKYFTISGIIARLAFQELIGQPETVKDARHQLQSKLWSFLGVAFRVGIYLTLAYLGLTIGLLIIGFILAFLSSLLFNNQGVTIIVTILLTIAFVIVFLAGFIWFFSRWIIAELPLAVEADIQGGTSIQRSWHLTKKSVRRIIVIVSVAFLVTLPLVAFTNYVPSILLLMVEEGSSLYWLIYFVSLFISFLGGMIILPFWQVIKAVLYYDLRSRREGLDLLS